MSAQDLLALIVPLLSDEQLQFIASMQEGTPIPAPSSNGDFTPSEAHVEA